MYYQSLFDSYFSPTRILVVSEERLKAAERKVKEDELTAVDVRITELTKYRNELKTELTKLAPVKPGKDLDALDREPQSLEEALTGE
tara:strand:+ start:686 stop:946 length:261 start_codon:yes stop_codon:yes gene_type:complete